MMPKLSIITICYNEPRLEDTCKSIVNQTWQDFEWIVIDGGSGEETQKIFDKYKYRINKFISEPDNGRYSAMNKGIRLANGEWLNFMNAGDYFHYNNALKDVFENKTYAAGILYANEKFITDNMQIVETVPESVGSRYFINNTIRHQSSFIKRNLFDKYGLYNENLQIFSDHEKWIQFSQGKEIFQYLPYIIACFNLGGISAANSQKHKKEKIDTIKKYYTIEQLNQVENEYEKKIKHYHY